MEYAVGSTGRIITARLFEGEELYESVESLAVNEKIHNAAVLITGGFRQADVVVGPVREKPKIEADMRRFTGPGETFGVGTIYCNEDGVPKMHIHAGMCRGDKVVVGCPRGGAKVFLILEITIIEITGVQGCRKLDSESGFRLLRF